MGAHGEGEAVPDNVHSIAGNLEVSHSPPEAVFARDALNSDVIGQTNSDVVAAHVQRMLDKSPSSFESFPIPSRLSPQTIRAINNAAEGLQTVEGDAVAVIAASQPKARRLVLAMEPGIVSSRLDLSRGMPSMAGFIGLPRFPVSLG